MIVRSRASWQPRHADGVASAPLPARLFLHHSVTSPPPVSVTTAAEAAHMRTLEAIGQDRFGSGISYTWVVFPSGRVWQGHSVSRQGTHTGGHNLSGRGICWVGDYEQIDTPTPAMVQATAHLVAHLRSVGIATSHPLAGHRDVRATACPGRMAYRLLADIERIAAGGAGGGSGGTMSWSERLNVPKWITDEFGGDFPDGAAAASTLLASGYGWSRLGVREARRRHAELLDRLDRVEGKIEDMPSPSFTAADVAAEIIRQMGGTTP